MQDSNKAHDLTLVGLMIILIISIGFFAAQAQAQFDSGQLLTAKMEGYCTRMMSGWRQLAREHDLDISGKYHEDCMDKQQQALLYINQLIDSNDERRVQRIVQEMYADDGNMMMLLFNLEFGLSGQTLPIRYNSQAIPYLEHDLPTGY